VIVRAWEKSPVLIVMPAHVPVPSRSTTCGDNAPLPIEPRCRDARFRPGVSVIRGAPTPSSTSRALLENGENSATYGRFVTIKLGERRVALGVDGVAGLTNLDSAQLAELPRFCEMPPPTSSRQSAPAMRSSWLCFVLRASFR